jgi:hypothetical protein
LEAEPQERFVWDSEVMGFGVRVKPTGVKSYVLKYRRGQTTKRVTISKVAGAYTVSEARERARAMLRPVALGEDPGIERAKGRHARTVGEIADDG